MPGAIKNRNVKGNAAIDSFKINFGYATIAAFQAAKGTARELDTDLVEGDFFYDTTLNKLQVYDGSSWLVVPTLTAQKFLNIPVHAMPEIDGTPLVAFADGVSTTPGISATAEGLGVRWNNDSAPDPIGTSIPYPPDLDPANDVVLHILAYKTGATVGDAVTWTVTAFENVDGALFDADADFGGASSAMTGDAATKTVQEETLTLAAANITGSPGTLNLTIQPTDGTLGTDDVTLLGLWLEYTQLSLTS